MSDRARSSVRTEARDGSGTADGVPEAAAPVEGGATAVGAGGPAQAAAPSAGPSASKPTPAAGPTAGPAAGPTAQPGRGEEPLQQGRPSGPPPAVDGTQVITADSTPSGVFAGARPPAPTSPAGDGPAGPTRPASPLVPPPGAPPVQGAGRPVGARSQAPAAPAAAPGGIDSTQAVPLATADDRSGRSSAGAAAAAGAAGAGAGAKTAAGRERGRGAARGPRRARLQLRHIDTWSALKISLVVSIALFFVWMVAVAVLYGVLGGLGVFDTLNDLIGQLSSASGSEGGGGGDVITAKVVLVTAAVIGAVNIVLLTALCTVAAYVYNLCSDLVGGLEVTLAEHE
jgi:Transmembrane domain of unknown function (DUF3566)